MKRLKAMKICALCVSAVMLISFVNTTYDASAAKSIAQLKKELNENTQKKQAAIKEKTQKQAELNSASDKKSDLDIQIVALQSDIDAIETVINQKEQEIQDKAEQIENISVQIDETKDVLKERMKIMYERSTTSYLEMLFESKGLSDLFTRVAVIRDIVSHDRHMIDEYAQARTEIEQAKSVIETEQEEQKTAKSMLEEKKSDMKVKQEEYNNLVSALTKEVAELEKFQQENEKYEAQARAELQKAMEEAAKAEKAKAEKTKNNSSGSTTTASAAKVTNGEFGWPSASSTRVTSEFNPNRKNPVTGVWRAHKGMDIGAPHGSDVLASKDGTVVTAKWNNGYGYYITINHGNGIATLYAHNSKLLVKAGDTVKKGQVIAKVGSTGNSTGPHIHFEVIVDGVQKNPRNYL